MMRLPKNQRPLLLNSLLSSKLFYFLMLEKVHVIVLNLHWSWLTASFSSRVTLLVKNSSKKSRLIPMIARQCLIERFIQL